MPRVRKARPVRREMSVPPVRRDPLALRGPRVRRASRVSMAFLAFKALKVRKV